MVTPRRWSPWRKRGAPPTRRRFVHDWDRLAYLYSKADYWLRVARRRANARRYLARIDALARRLGRKNREGLVLWASRALLAEWRVDARRAAHATARVVDGIETILREWPACPDVTVGDLRAERGALEALRRAE